MGKRLYYTKKEKTKVFGEIFLDPLLDDRVPEDVYDLLFDLGALRLDEALSINLNELLDSANGNMDLVVKTLDVLCEMCGDDSLAIITGKEDIVSVNVGDYILFEGFNGYHYYRRDAVEDRKNELKNKLFEFMCKEIPMLEHACMVKDTKSIINEFDDNFSYSHIAENINSSLNNIL